ncbi:melatonin receptor type 1B-A-like [Saccostrea echinata]|uniref:melatonin receptor type 1B-A-like n=1 Tax=Saccostrea echinata TaxID=191078 RepID=UPI002A807785|nr:melatonin receptor type 1B-A-like [Saccostrea echinata]
MTVNNSIDDHVHQAIQDFAWNRTLHQTLSTFIAVVGTILNLIAISVLVKGGLYRQSPFKFVLNLFVSNLFMCSVCLPIISSYTFSEHLENNGVCSFYGYIIYSILGTAVLNIVLISLNRYFLIVRFTLYRKIYTARNIRIMLAVVWTFYPILFLFPLSGIWGSFSYDRFRFICHPVHSSDGFRDFAFTITLLLTVPSILFCYIEILKKVNSTFRRVRNLQRAQARRLRNERQLVRTILVTIILFSCMNLPFIVLSIADPYMDKASLAAHGFVIYLGWSNAVINPMIYSILNNQIKSSLLDIIGKILKRNSRRIFPSEMPKLEIRVISLPLQESSVFVEVREIKYPN